jgi:uncharacterized membrane protein
MSSMAALTRLFPDMRAVFRYETGWQRILLEREAHMTTSEEPEQAARPTQPARPSKQPITQLAGPYGHPFHPIMVTVPIGAWVASFVFDIASLTVAEPEPFTFGSRWLIGIGVVGAVVAAVLGLLDFLTIPRKTAARRTGLTHAALNVAVVVLFAVSFAMRLGQPADVPVDATLVVLSVVALAALGASGWLGGKLAYRYGVRVADEETQAEGYR